MWQDEDIVEIVAKITPALERQLIETLPPYILKYVPEALSKLNVSLQDVADLTGLSYASVYAAQQKGLLKAAYVDGVGLRVNLGNLFSFLNQREEKKRLKITKTSQGERWDVLPDRPVRRDN